MICNKCGHQNKDDAKFCGACGNALGTTQTINNNEEVEQLEDFNQPTQPTPVVKMPEPSTTTIQLNTTPTPVVEQKQPIEKPKKKKTALIIIIAILAVVIIAVVFLITNTNKQPSEKESINSFFDPEKPIRVKDKDGMYRFIDQNGKFTTNNAYLYATDYYNNYAVVTAETIKDDSKIHVDQIIDKKGNVKKETPGSIEYHEKLNLWVIDNILYDANLKQISPKDTLVQIADDDSEYFEWVNSKSNTGGIMNSKGKITYTYKFQGEENYIAVEPIETELKDKYCIVNIEAEKYAIINCDDGTVVYDYTQDYISDDDDNIFEIKNDDTYDRIEIMYIQDNKIIYRSSSEDISLYYNDENYITIRDASKDYDERYSYLDLATLEISKEIPETIEDEEEDLDEWEKISGFKKFSCSNGYGIMTKEKILLPCEWDYIEYLDTNVYKYLASKKQNYILAEKDNKTYIIDINTQKQLAELNASYVVTDEESVFIYYKDTVSNETKIHNLSTNKTATMPKEYSIYIYSNYAVAKDYNTGTANYYNNNGKLIYTEKTKN